METIARFNEILKSFKIGAVCINAKQVGNYTYYDLNIGSNTKVAVLSKFSDEISLALKMPCKPSIRVIHERGIVRLEFVTPVDKTLKLFDLFTNDNVPTGGLMCLLGQSVDGSKVWMDLAQNPHMIVAGTTGSGKSVLLQNIIANMFNYNDCILYLVDPKKIEFHEYGKRIKRDLNVSFTYDEAMFVLDTLLATMEERYRLIRSGRAVEDFPYVLLMIDEFADLIMQDKDNLFFEKLCRLAQKCRAARISIILSTQRPSTNIISGIIKANFPARIACKVASHVDSKVIMDSSGAENLLGRGDALLRDNFRQLERFQVAFTTATEVCNYFGDAEKSDSLFAE
jgi:DNA segregation ATPase FtsK/SpoIIIE, S-DNA-T family